MQQHSRTFTGVAGARPLHYLLALPTAYQQDPTLRWPLLLFLHGRGESGDDLELLKLHGIPKVLASATDFPFVTVSPQCPTEVSWEDLVESLIGLVDEIQTRYRIDERRTYLTGLSMGGRGSWRLATLYPQRFAALAPICGRIPTLPNFLTRVLVLKDKPIWVFHGAKDPVVPIENSETIVTTLRAAGSQVRFTVYPEADHDSWSASYANPALYEWLLRQSLPD